MSGCSEQERGVRVDLAAAYRLAAINGWTDLNNTHFSARIPGTDTFLLNPFGMLFDEITASSLVKVDEQGTILGESSYPTNPAGFVIHGALHMNVADAHCVMHTHSRFGTAVAMQRHGLLPATRLRGGRAGRSRTTAHRLRLRRSKDPDSAQPRVDERRQDGR